jgi:hypothetical protein
MQGMEMGATQPFHEEAEICFLAREVRFVEGVNDREI